MKYYKYVSEEMSKEAAIKIPKIQSPKEKFKKMSLGKKIGTGIGVASTAMAVGGSAIDAGKEMFKPIDTSSTKGGFKHGLMSVNPELNKKASAQHDSLESSRLKYLPVVAGATTAGLIGVGVATGKVNKKVLAKEGKKALRKASKVYNAGSQVVGGAMKVAKSGKKNKELKEMFNAFKSRTGNTAMEFDDFKELNEAYERFKKVKGQTSVSFDDWANKNASRFAFNNKGGANDGFKKTKKTPFIDIVKQKAGNATDAAINGAAFSAAATGANFIGHEIGDEYFNKKDKDETRRRFREDWNNNFADHVVKGKPIKRNYNTGYKTPKQKSREYVKKHKREIYKSASAPAGDFVNHADDMLNAASKKLKGKELFKDIVKNDVVKPAVTGVAYIGAPALIASATKRDRNTMRKIEDTKTERVVMDVPEKMVKKASLKDKVISNAKKIKTDYIPENLGQEFARAGVRGASMAAPVALISYKTNRNLRGNMEKLEDKNKSLKPVDKGNVRITVERRVDNV